MPSRAATTGRCRFSPGHRRGQDRLLTLNHADRSERDTGLCLAPGRHAGPGHFICVNPGEVHDGRAIGGGSRAWRILYFDPMELTNLCADVLAGKSGAFAFIAPVFAVPGLHRLFDDAFHYRAGQDGTMPCETAVLQLVARLGFHSTIRPVRAEGSVPSICRARERIDADWRPPSCCLSMAST